MPKMSKPGPVSFIIRDANTREVFQRHPGPNGWYDLDHAYARRYKTRKNAQRTIDRGNPNVGYPGSRQLEVVEIQEVVGHTIYVGEQPFLSVPAGGDRYAVLNDLINKGI